MTVEQVICDRLLDISALAARVATRVYLEKLPQRPTYPAVVVQLIDDSSRYHLRGEVDGARARVQVDSYAAETAGVNAYESATDVAALVHGDGRGVSSTGLSGWKGARGNPAFEVLACLRVDRRKRYESDELRTICISQDYMVTYRPN